MKDLLVLCSLFYINYGFAQAQLTTAQWQEDLRFLQKTVHKEFPFLFKKVTAEDFDAVVEAFYEDIPNMEEHQIRVGFNKMVAMFKYGHTQVPYSNVTKAGILPINLYQFSDGIYIEGVHKDYKNTLGAKVLAIEDTPINKAVEMIYPVVPVENDQYFKAYGIRYLLSAEALHAQNIIPELSENITLSLEKNGNSFKQAFRLITTDQKPRAFNFTMPTENWVTARDTSITPLYLKHLDEKYYFFEYLEDNKTLYVRQSSVFDHESESLKDFYARLFEFIDAHEINRLIYDVRLNGGGNNYNNLPFIKGLMARPKVNTRGKFFFIIGRDTFSAGQNLTNEVLRYTEAIIVGEPTGENENFYGDNRPVVLRNSGIKAYLSYAWWQDRPQWEGRDATLPHVAVAMSYADYIANEDVVLKAAMEFTDDGFILDPMQHLTELFISGDFETLKKDASVIAQDERYRYYDFEEEFSKAGARLISQDNLQGALFVYSLIAENYPNSVGAWYNLAGVQKSLKQKEEAIDSYKKIIGIDPNHVLANASKKMIDKLENN